MELEIFKVRNKGEQKEEIIIKVLEDCNLSDFIIYDETFDSSGNESNVWPHMYRFAPCNVKADEYIVLRTHKGKDGRGRTTKDDVCHFFFWGFDNNVSIFNKEGDTIHIVKIVDETLKEV